MRNSYNAFPIPYSKNRIYFKNYVIIYKILTTTEPICNFLKTNELRSFFLKKLKK